MDMKKVKELVAMMKDNELSELELIDGSERITLKRGGEPVVALAGPAPVASAPAPAPTAAAPADAEQNPEVSGLIEIVSPIVGTFYAAPSPDADPYVSVGDSVEESTVVCIVEAMKVMNEIKSNVRGTIKKVLVANGAAVSYGQALFMVEPI